MPWTGSKHYFAGLSRSHAQAEAERDDERATDFVESLDRGLRLLQCFGTTAAR